MIALGVGLGLGVAAVMNLPPMGQRVTGVVVVVWVVSMLAAYLGARRDGARATAVAVATAVSEATAEANAKLDAVLQQAVIVNVAGPGGPALAGEGAGALVQELVEGSKTGLLGGARVASDDAGVQLGGEAVRERVFEGLPLCPSNRGQSAQKLRE